MSGVLYQIYPRSFNDSDGDGIGDIRGIIDRLDYLEWLGVDGLWLCPVTISPNADWGYDVADYLAVQPEYGSVEDIDELVAASGRRGIKVLLDLVPNHTSDRHPWFLNSRSSRVAPLRDWYVWAAPKADGSPPNNWVSSFMGPAWNFDDLTAQYYLHNFLPQQPDLNWWNEEVREAFDGILRFWFERGVAGFRIDVAHMIVKDAALRDNPPATQQDDFASQLYGQRSVYNSNRPEVHEVMRRWRRVADNFTPPRVLVGETNVEDLEVMTSFYGSGQDELHLAFNFPFINSAFVAEDLRKVVEATEALLPSQAWPVWTGSNHDVSRLGSRWAKGDVDKTRVALVMLLCLRGTPVLYQGDEIGLKDATLTREELRDPVGVKFWPAYAGRDPVRTPMPWAGGFGGGFTAPETRPWLPVGEPAGLNVESQQNDPDSTLSLARRVIAARRESTDLRCGAYATLPSPEGVWTWRRGERTVVTLNLSDSPASVEATDGVVVLGTRRSREGEAFSGTLGPWEALVLEEDLK